MVRRILLVIDDIDYEQLKSLKGNKSWEEFLVKDRLADSEAKQGTGKVSSRKAEPKRPRT